MRIFLILIVGFVAEGFLAQELARPREAPSIGPAQQFFTRFVYLLQRESYQLISLYADHAEVFEPVKPGKSLFFNGDQYKVYLRAKLRPLNLRNRNKSLKVVFNPEIKFPNVAYIPLQNGDVRIKGIYYLRLKRQYGTFSLVVSQTGRTRWQIVFQRFDESQ